MKRIGSRRGFTLVEMLVVIAIIAVLVAVVIPTVSSSTAKAKAATDAANLRAIYGEANIVVLQSGEDNAIETVQAEKTECKSFPGADLRLVYTEPGFVGVYYVDDGKYYGLDYFSEFAEKGSSAVSTNEPQFPQEDHAHWRSLSAGD